MTDMLKYAVIVAGGKGLRMGGSLPKQFLPIGGKTVLMHTIEAFRRYDSGLRIVLVLPCEQRAYWQGLCREYGFGVEHTVVNGGDTRFHSVKNGLEAVEGPGLTAVHDGVRPFVSSGVIARCFDMAAEKKAVIPVTDVVDTMRHVEGAESVTVPRNAYRLVQTPQVFDTELLKKAYAQPYRPDFTDDASVVEAYGVPVTLTEGNRENIKITTPFDLKIAEALLRPCSI